MPISKWAYLAAFSVPLFLVLGYALGGPFNFATPLFVFGAIPLLDQVLGRRALAFNRLQQYPA